MEATDFFPESNFTSEVTTISGADIKANTGAIKFTTKQTKKSSHKEVNKTLGERQRIVLDHLKTVFNDGATAKELSNSLYRQGLVPSPERNSVHPRLKELVDAGLVTIVGKKTCQFTSRKVAIYKSK
jgi:hypothetical protein